MTSTTITARTTARRWNYRSSSSSSFAQVLFFFVFCLMMATTNAYLEESELSNDDELTLELWRIVDQQAKLKDEEQDQEQAAFSERTLLGAIGHFRTTTTISSSSTTDEDSNSNNSQSCAAQNEDTQQEKDDEMKNCQDRWKDDRCEAMAKRGECLYRYKDCPKTCLLCNVTENSIFKIGEAQSIPQNVIQEVQEYHHTTTTTTTENEDWKLLSNITTNEELLQRTAQIILDTQDYMSNIVMQENEYGPVRRSCLNYDAHCSAYAALGYCSSSFGSDDENDDFIWMMANCAPACQTCHELIHVQPCHVNFHHNVIHEGDLEIMFQSMAGENNENLPYKPKIFSRPGGDPMDDTIIDGAWLIALEDFLSYDECNHLIEMGAIRGYERSYLQDEDDVEEYRTSVNSWCEEECANDPIVQTILNRISDTTGIPSEYSEPLQMLRYTKGQYYKVHHDVALDSEFQLLYGPRILTFFLYLNDVEEGGATRMIDITDEGDDDEMDDEEEYDDDSTTTNAEEEDEEEPYTPTPIEVQPKRGMAVVWANLKDDDMKQREAGTWHEAMPVINGVKYGANAWYRLRRFEEDCDEEDFQEWKLKHNLKVMTMEDDSDDEDDENPKAAEDTTTSQTSTTM
eukprot:scaffold2310_cov49-Cylindrotheca_fusiformis.AAC.3